MTFARIHELKLLLDIRNIFLDDIVSIIEIINERIDVKVKPYRYDNTIELLSNVTGFEGYYPLLKLDVLINKNIQPVVYIESLPLRTKDAPGYKCKLTLSSVELEKILLVRESSKRRYKKYIRDIVMESTQSERVDLHDIVSDIFDAAYRNYELCGVMEKSGDGLL